MNTAPDSSGYVNATLPIRMEHGVELDEKSARHFGEELSGSYCFAEPYPHIVIDNFLPQSLVEEIWQRFPVDTLSDDLFFESGYSGLHKRRVHPESCDEYVRNIFHFFNSAPVLQFLEGLTAIEGLIGDPYFNGGGYHEISRGGKLGVHADFRINEQLHLNRRINILIYLNKDWDESWGGFLEIWDKKMTAKVTGVAPVFNRCVIFNTDADSFHGHPDPLNTPADVTRKSVALYYYTASKRVYEDTAAHSTMYVARPQDGTEIKRQAARLRLHNYLKDWIPPVAHRAARRLKDLITR